MKANCVCKFYDLVYRHAGSPFSPQICHTEESDRPDYTTPPGLTDREVRPALDNVIAFRTDMGDIRGLGFPSFFVFVRNWLLLKRG